jgi:hypothetical protein
MRATRFRGLAHRCGLTRLRTPPQDLETPCKTYSSEPPSLSSTRVLTGMRFASRLQSRIKRKPRTKNAGITD